MPRKPKANVAAPPEPIAQGVAQKTEQPNTAISAMERRYAGLRPWKPGQSGNPSGRPRSSIEMKQQAATYTDDAVKLKGMVLRLQLQRCELWLEVAGDPSLPPTERADAMDKAIKSIDALGLGAAQSLLDRGHGKPQQKVEVDSRGVLDEMSEDDLAVFIGTMGPQVIALIQGRRKKALDE